MPSTPNVGVIESVWDYPRPPRLEPTGRQVRVFHAGIVVAETTRALRILETSHPPVFYLPQADIRMQLLRPSTQRSSYCEFKGVATYWSLDLNGAHLPSGDPLAPTSSFATVAWTYPEPSRAFRALRDHFAFYPSKLDECTVDGERVQAQPGDFYGGWITSHVRGPFKGAPGTRDCRLSGQAIVRNPHASIAACGSGFRIKVSQTNRVRRFSAMSTPIPTSMPSTSGSYQYCAGWNASQKP